jgi:hypothetical protein
LQVTLPKPVDPKEDEKEFGGASRDRTDDLIVANDALSVNLSFLNQTHTVKTSA